MKQCVSPLWWLWLPLVFLFLQTTGEIFLPQDVLSILHSENGLHELLQFILLCSAFVVSITLLFRFSGQKRPWMFLWSLAAAAGCLYVAGEEISWGQQFFDWATPEAWTTVNDQGETNLHNTTSWLDQKPRLLLLIGIVTGGLLIPLLERVRPELVPERFRPVYPPAQLALVAALVLAIKIAERTGESLGVILFERSSEVEELLMYYFVLVYLCSLRKSS